MSRRDGWCTPKWLTDLLPEVDLDPCSNKRSTVRAATHYTLERKEDGLRLPWYGDVFVNPPYSDILPWAMKAHHELRERNVQALGFLVNVDCSTKWWHQLTEDLDLVFMFHKRIRFEPPPGVKSSSNSKPQALIGNARFFEICALNLFEHGRLYRVQSEVSISLRSAA